MSSYTITQEDVNKAEDQYCGVCKTKKEKYLGSILGQRAVMWRSLCTCGEESRSYLDKDKKTWETINTPFWKMMGLNPKDREVKLEKYLKSKGMTYGDYRKQQDYYLAKNQGAYKEWEKHINKYGRRSIDEKKYERS